MVSLTLASHGDKAQPSPAFQEVQGRQCSLVWADHQVLGTKGSARSCLNEGTQSQREALPGVPSPSALYPFGMTRPGPDIKTFNASLSIFFSWNLQTSGMKFCCRGHLTPGSLPAPHTPITEVHEQCVHSPRGTRSSWKREHPFCFQSVGWLLPAMCLTPAAIKPSKEISWLR